ncbi:hypothetical protein EJ04DRAFT_502053 [Polyplosphaeria fusca]|uniref:Uncharacterized protein n=1 Tax=Polyplosphaeria fusca TaxID=682080 RepID=A0A9P4QQE6_9PLEO|nr:hypothetical protein EJ04DRAFT_502053 [Polyplosphaeria fusca]
MSREQASKQAKKSNYRVRFRHGVCPQGRQVTRADIKKYDFFFEPGTTTWVSTMAADPSILSQYDEGVLSHMRARSLGLPYESSLAGPSRLGEAESELEWPLDDPTEAQLFRNWVEYVSHWWDTTSPENIWRDKIPKLALGNPMLLNAIFLHSAQHLRGVDPAWPAEPYHYHERLLNLLIPHIANRGCIDDEATLAAAIILRSFEDFVAGTDGQTHLDTFPLFTTAGGSLLDTRSTVVKSCFLKHVRFEVHAALLGRPSLHVNYQNFVLPDLIEPANEISWNNRIVWITARVLQWCTEDSHASEAWSELNRLVNGWEKSRPSSFAPYFYRDVSTDEGRYYPDLWYSTPCHTEANQYVRIARIALAQRDPDATRPGEEGHRAEYESREQIVERLKEVIAIARCNGHRMPALFLASNAVFAYGSTVEDHFDRVKMIEFLEEVEGVGWPTKSAMRWLASQWGWSVEDST